MKIGRSTATIGRWWRGMTRLHEEVIASACNGGADPTLAAVNPVQGTFPQVNLPRNGHHDGVGARRVLELCRANKDTALVSVRRHMTPKCSTAIWRVQLISAT